MLLLKHVLLEKGLGEGDAAVALDLVIKQCGYNSTVLTYMLESGGSTHTGNTKNLGIDDLVTNTVSRKHNAHLVFYAHN